MNVLIVEPEKVPHEAEIENSLKSMQAIVGGTIEAVYPYEDPVALVCNDEGKLLNMPLNRAVRDENGKPYDVLAGTFMVVGLSEDDFDSLPSDLMKKYEAQFHDPEVFMRMGKGIMSFKLPIEKPKEHTKIARPSAGHDDR